VNSEHGGWKTDATQEGHREDECYSDHQEVKLSFHRPEVGHDEFWEETKEQNEKSLPFRRPSWKTHGNPVL